MVEVSILSNKGYCQKQSFAAADLAHSGLLDFLRGKMYEGEIVFAVIDEDSLLSYAFIEENTIVVLSSEDFFEKFISSGFQSLKQPFGSGQSDFEILKDLLYSEEWPQAVYGAQIANENSEKDKDERAEGIADILLPPLEGKRFLDFGCGEGHVANYASKSAEISVGYDIVKNSKSRFDWESEEGKSLFTTDLDKARSKGPFDIILLYDVLDHARESSPQEILVTAKSLLADDGKIYSRMHPWTSRHGGHAYRKINKAFVHLVFTEEELKSMGVEPEHNLKILSPMSTYDSWLEGSGLKKSNDPEVDEQGTELFFRDNPVVNKRIMKLFGAKEWGEGVPPGKPVWQMSQCFWDYVLEKE
jgi:2-polyprenyl-3-methyl-5-hydroxy-6-metoxy-1,4-benzoquinol methylase